MREFVNAISNPIYSFSLVTIGFFVMMRYAQEFFGKRRYIIGTILASLLFLIWGARDPNFFKIIAWSDNFPIFILGYGIIWLTWYSLHKGIKNDERIDRGEPPIEGTPENREKVWSWPNLVYTELFVIILGTVFLIVWAIFLKAPLEEPANPTWAPNPAKAPWYFLGLQEMLVYFDPWYAGVVLPGLIVVGLIALPYLDTNPKGNGYFTFKERKFAITTYLFGWLILWNFLIVIGTFLRGPNWTFYGPFEYWDLHKVVAESNINLSEIVWIKWFNTRMPSNIIIREIFGLLAVAAFFVLPTIYLNKKWGGTFLKSMGYARYYLMIFLLLCMASLPLKMVLRWLFGLKYIVALPELELNL